MVLSIIPKLTKLLVVSLTPYFLDKGNLWLEENEQKILDARKTQPFFENNIIFMRQGQTYALTELLRKLDEIGYEKVFQVHDPGEFSHRGGFVDLFPVNLNHAVRLEFIGNTIESIEPLDISVQDEQTTKSHLKKRLKSQKLFSDLKGIKPGDYLVHLDHGVARLTGIERMEIGSSPHEYYVLEYAAGDRLFVPVGLERKLSRYIGFEEPAISRLGSPVWQKTKRRIKEKVEKLARSLLELYAKREVTNRSPYSIEGEISKHVASTFPFQETPDQSQAMDDIKEDLLKEEPMDRIVCGDVGFGKTEIALRTMVRAIENGYQAALMAPTTILAYQHFQSFRERLSRLPIRVALLSRIQSKKEQNEIIEKVKTGAIDIVIGTHRLLSSDVLFKNLGLLVIDDEQRFGVKQKEKLREMRTSLDVLSLSATPIPRTLYMALSSLKKIGLVQTPPEGRLPVETVVSKWNEKIVKEAIEKEIKRKGQAYYLHNRIGTIDAVEHFLKKLIPDITVGVAHGRMTEKTLIRTMDEFRQGKYDVLVATTIIENGLDLPNVNTLLVSDAAKLGLSQAYQIRGRIGRSYIQSYAYFFHGSRLKGTARLRLQALKEARELGSGYKVALRDMEIRGAGNILGKEQSGNVNAVGLNLYCQMLSEAVDKLKNT